MGSVRNFLFVIRIRILVHKILSFYTPPGTARTCDGSMTVLVDFTSGYNDEKANGKSLFTRVAFHCIPLYG